MDAPKKLYEKLKEDTLFIAGDYLDTKIKMKELSKTKNVIRYFKKCHICEKKFEDTPPFIEKKKKKNIK